MTDAPPDTPTALVERYRYEALIGSGGQGRTVRATRLEDGEAVVVKELHLARVEDWKSVELFEREAETLRRLDVPGVPKLIESLSAEAPDGTPRFYLVQELIPGQSLLDTLTSGRRFSEAEAVQLALDVLDILEALHTWTPPVIHRDLKPSNIILRPDDGVALVDFGAVAASLESESAEGGSTVAGTFGYMAPEQFRGRATPASDIYGLGATLVHVLSGRSPNEMETHGGFQLAFQSHVQASPQLINLLEHMLQVDETLRIPTAADARRALQSYHTLPRPESDAPLVVVAREPGELESVGQAGSMELFNALPQAPRSIPAVYGKRFRRHLLMIVGGGGLGGILFLLFAAKMVEGSGPIELLILIGLPIFLGYTAFSELFGARRLLKRGRKAVGVVTEIVGQNDGTIVRYEFSADGVLCQGQSLIKGAPVVIERGHHVGVLYDPDKPGERSMIYPVPAKSVTGVLS